MIIRFLNYHEFLRGQTVHWMGAKLCVCMFLDSRDKSLNNPKCNCTPLTKVSWIPSTNAYDVNLKGTFVLLVTPQQANITNCAIFRNCKWIPQKRSGIRKNLNGICKLFADSTYIGGFRLQLWTPQQLFVFIQMSYYLFVESTNCS